MLGHRYGAVVLLVLTTGLQFRAASARTPTFTDVAASVGVLFQHVNGATDENPYLYLNPNALREAGLEAEAVERFLAEQIRQEDGIAYDTHVPIIFAGHRVGAQKIKRQRVARSAAEITHRMSRLNRGFLGGSCRQRALVHGSRFDSMIMPSPTRSHAR